MRYRRVLAPGGSFFFTLVTHLRRPILASEEEISALREAFRAVKATRPFEIDAIVVLPDHLHCIWTLPPEDPDYATRWRLVKTHFSKHAPSSVRGPLDPSRQVRREQAVWQHRYWEHMIRDESDFIRHMDYIHWNPVKHGYVTSPEQWPHSSYHRYAATDIYPPAWGCGEMNFDDIDNE